MPTDQQTLCAGDAATANASGITLQNDIGIYLTHGKQHLSGYCVAINTENGTFRPTADLVSSTIQYIIFRRLPNESGTVGIFTLGNACTQVAAGSTVVFL